MTAQLLEKVGFLKTKSTDNHHIASIRGKLRALSLVKKDGETWNLGQNKKSSPICYSDVQKLFTS